MDTYIFILTKIQSRYINNTPSGSFILVQELTVRVSGKKRRRGGRRESGCGWDEVWVVEGRSWLSEEDVEVVFGLLCRTWAGQENTKGREKTRGTQGNNGIQVIIYTKAWREERK